MTPLFSSTSEAGGVPVSVPQVLAGPIVRRVTRDSVAVWVASSEAAAVGLKVWRDAQESISPNKVKSGAAAVAEGTADMRTFGAKLHVAVVVAKANQGAALAPGIVHSYDLTIGADNLRTLKLLQGRAGGPAAPPTWSRFLLPGPSGARVRARPVAHVRHCGAGADRPVPGPHLVPAHDAEGPDALATSTDVTSRRRASTCPTGPSSSSCPAIRSTRKISRLLSGNLDDAAIVWRLMSPVADNCVPFVGVPEQGGRPGAIELEQRPLVHLRDDGSTDVTHPRGVLLLSAPGAARDTDRLRLAEEEVQRVGAVVTQPLPAGTHVQRRHARMGRPPEAGRRGRGMERPALRRGADAVPCSTVRVWESTTLGVVASVAEIENPDTPESRYFQNVKIFERDEAGSWRLTYWPVTGKPHP